jgi:twitching motility protein PilT
MQVGQERYAMQTLNQCLYSLVQRRLISVEEALGRSIESEELRMMLEGRTAAQVGTAAGAQAGLAAAKR